MNREVEFMMRVKLPSPGGYASCPSGDTEYEGDFQKAIFAAKPPGFEVKWPRTGQRWPVDSEGFTFVPLFLSDTSRSGKENQWIDLYFGEKERHDSLRARVKEFAATIQ